MAGSTTKKAIVRRFDKEPLAGYVNPFSYLQTGGVELMSAQGNLSTVPYEDIKSIAFVRDFDGRDVDRRVFNNRPRIEGLWVSFQFRDGEVMEGVMPNNLLQVEQHGFTVIPPDPYSNNQRIFIPRAALFSVEVLGVVGSPLKKRRAKVASKEQIGLFDE
ncbi:MAG TPA: hypothetical protein VMH81_22955 [Bryobacteraceae bacterium]|nr:hypothetical protein [Bryobacteraceae bacterium]